MSFDEILARLTLNAALPTAPRVQHRLIAAFGSAKSVCVASLQDLKQRGMLSDLQVDKLTALRPEQFSSVVTRLQDRGVTILTNLDPDYPECLRNIATYPTVLFVAGNPQKLNSKQALGVVGARQMTPYGERVIQHVLPPVIRAGVLIVSGLALGVDGCAHQCTLDHAGDTVAVQAQGVLQAYPRRHQQLYDRILSAGGAVISEFAMPPEGIPEPTLFPRRNRLISGLANGVLVVEAAQKSGALITAEYALDQGRNVYAVPGDIFSEMSAGCHRLISQGAKPVLSAQDILEDFGFAKSAVQKTLPLVQNMTQPRQPAFDHFESPLECRIINLCREPLSLDDLQNETGEAPSVLSAAVTKLELIGRLNALPGRRFVQV